jgi:hypothetical protein
MLTSGLMNIREHMHKLQLFTTVIKVACKGHISLLGLD